MPEIFDAAGNALLTEHAARLLATMSQPPAPGPSLSTSPWPAELQTELLVDPRHAMQVRDAWSRMDALERDPARVAAMRAAGDAPRYEVVDGAAIIPIAGSLTNRGDYMGYDFATSYGAIAREVSRAAADPAVDRIVLAVNSPGGTVSGIELAEDAISAARAHKPVVAHISGLSASAAYWLSAQADEIVATRLSEAGSIGVYTMHMDVSGLLKQMGIEVSVISSGRHKVDGHPFGPLTKDVRADIQARIDQLRLTFARAIGSGRGARLPSDAALATEARVFPADAALAAGLIDRIGTFKSVLSEYPSAPAGRTTSQTRRSSMSETSGAPSAEAQGIPKADHDAAVKTARADGRAEGEKAGTDRLAAVLGADGIKGNAARMSAALDLAVKAPGMAAADVTAFVVGNVAEVADGDSFARRMSAQGNADTGSGSKGSKGQTPEAAVASAFTAAIDRVNARA